MKRDHRKVMTVEEFDAIRADDDYPIDGYYDTLIDRNERIGHDIFERRDRRSELTVGQRMLIELGTFDSQVNNGGITQYFWNCPDSILDVGDWIEQLGSPELKANYGRAVEALVGNKDRWAASKEEWIRGGDYPNWELFRHTYELLDLEWFDRAYFDRYGYDDKGRWVCQNRGLNHDLLMRLAEYIRSHRGEFIKEP